MQETALFSLKKVANLLDQYVSQAAIDREDSDLIKRLLERHVSLGTLTPDFRKLPTRSNPVDDLQPLDLHQTLNVEDFFVKSAGLAASLRALSIESASLSARLYGLKLEIEELERQKKDLEKYINNLPTESLADAMVKDAERSQTYSLSEIENMRQHARDLRNRALSWHTYAKIGEDKTYADRDLRYQRTIARAGNWKSVGTEYQADEMMSQDATPGHVREAAGFAAHTVAAMEHDERRSELNDDASALDRSINAAEALKQTYINNVERAKYSRDMLYSRLAAIETLLKSRRALYFGKKGDPYDPQHPFDPTCPDEIDILGRLHAVSVRYAHERRLLRKYLIALLHAYGQVYNRKASPAVTGVWGQLLQSEDFFDHVDDVYLLLSEFELLMQRLATNARRTFVVREVTFPSLSDTLPITFDNFELQDYPLARIRGLSAALLADEGYLTVSFNTLRREGQGLRSGEIPLVLPLALQPSPPVFATNDFWNEPLDSGWEIQVRSHSGSVQVPVRLLICWHVECADLQDLLV
jgi:hypothetical protein